MRDHRPKLDIPGIGTWIIDSDTNKIEFLGDQDAYAHGIRANLSRALSIPDRAVFVDPRMRFVLIDALEEILRGEAASGELKTVARLRRIDDTGLLRGKFAASNPIVFVYEHGVVVLDEKGECLWSRDDLMLTDHFQGVQSGKIVYSSESRGIWKYDLLTGKQESF